jgi:RNA polymerase sigma-70 factor (ECF subfamily)
VNLSDAELIRRTLAHDDRSAFGELVLRHQSSVRNFLRQLTRGDAALADDLAQETFVTAYRNLARFQNTAAFSTWLLGIAHNHWRNARRSQRDHEELQDNSADTSTNLELKHDLASALKELTADEQLAIHLGYHEGLTHTEIAALLAWPLGTVKTHLARGKEKLRHLLASWNPQT